MRKFISEKQTNFNVQIRENHSSRLNEFEIYGGGQALIFSMDALLSYALTDLSGPQYEFIQYVKICDKQSPVLADSMVEGFKSNKDGWIIWTGVTEETNLLDTEVERLEAIAVVKAPWGHGHRAKVRNLLYNEEWEMH